MHIKISGTTPAGNFVSKFIRLENFKNDEETIENLKTKLTQKLLELYTIKPGNSYDSLRFDKFDVIEVAHSNAGGCYKDQKIISKGEKVLIPGIGKIGFQTRGLKSSNNNCLFAVLFSIMMSKGMNINHYQMIFVSFYF